MYSRGIRVMQLVSRNRRSTTASNAVSRHLVSVRPCLRAPARSRRTRVTDDSTAAGENGGTADGATTDANDWRVTVRLHAGHQVGSAVKHVSSHRVEDEVQIRLGGRVVVGTDGGAELFLYTHAQDAALAAQQSVSELLASHGLDADYTVERWHPIAEEWEAADVPLPGTRAQVQAEHKQLDAEETSESVSTGVAMFEVRVQLP